MSRGGWRKFPQRVRVPPRQIASHARRGAGSCRAGRRAAWQRSCPDSGSEDAMTIRTCTGSATRWLAAGVGVGAGVYAASAGLAWTRYGRPTRPSGPQRDELLDRVMPRYDIVERHHVRVDAPAAVTL